MKIDPHFNIGINSKVISTARELGSSAGKSKNWPESKVRRLCAEAMKFLAENPGKHQSRTIWEAINPDEPFSPSWNHFIVPFLQAGHTFGRKPLIEVDKTNPKRTFYAFGDFDATIEYVDKPLKAGDETVFDLSNGREVAGRGGRFLHLLVEASAANPVTTQQVLDRLYTPVELARLTDEARRSVLSGLASRARQDIKGTNLVVRKVWTDEIDSESHRRLPGYYMVEVEPPEKRLPLHEATVLAGFLYNHNHILENHGLEPMPKEVFEALNQRVIETYTDGEKTTADLCELRQRAFDKAMALLNNPEELEEVVNSLEELNDPRYDLIVQLLSYTSEEQVELIKKLLAAQTDVAVTFDASRRGGYAFVGSSQRVVAQDGTEL